MLQASPISRDVITNFSKGIINNSKQEWLTISKEIALIVNLSQWKVDLISETNFLRYFDLKIEITQEFQYTHLETLMTNLIDNSNIDLLESLELRFDNSIG